MFIYSITTLCSIFFALIGQSIKKDTLPKKMMSQYLYFLATIPLFLVAALRYNVGTDYPFTYTQRFLWRIDGIDISEFFEPGFMLLIDSIIFFTKNPQWLFAISAAIFIFFTYKAIYQQSNNICISIFILVIGGHFFSSLNLMRNYIALSIVLYAFKYIKSRELIKYTIYFLIAMSFHISIVILYFIYFLYNYKISKREIVIIIVVTLIGIPILDKIFRYIISFTDYYWYYNKNNSNVTPQISLLILNVIILTIQTYFYGKGSSKDDKLYNLYMKIQLIIVVIAICSFFVPMIRRLILIPIFIQILSIPYIFKYINEKNKKIFVFIIICGVSMLVTYRQIVVLGMHEVLPYQTIFNK